MLNRLAVGAGEVASWLSGILMLAGSSWRAAAMLTMAICTFGAGTYSGVASWGVDSSSLTWSACVWGPVFGSLLSASGIMCSLPGFWKLAGTTLLHSPGYHPQANGQTERMVQMIASAIGVYIARIEDPTEWKKAVPHIQFQVNNTKSTQNRHQQNSPQTKSSRTSHRTTQWAYYPGNVFIHYWASV